MVTTADCRSANEGSIPFAPAFKKSGVGSQKSELVLTPDFRLLTSKRERLLTVKMAGCDPADGGSIPPAPLMAAVKRRPKFGQAPRAKFGAPVLCQSFANEEIMSTLSLENWEHARGERARRARGAKPVARGQRLKATAWLEGEIVWRDGAVGWETASQIVVPDAAQIEGARRVLLPLGRDEIAARRLEKWELARKLGPLRAPDLALLCAASRRRNPAALGRLAPLLVVEALGVELPHSPARALGLAWPHSQSALEGVIFDETWPRGARELAAFVAGAADPVFAARLPRTARDGTSLRAIAAWGARWQREANWLASVAPALMLEAARRGEATARAGLELSASAAPFAPDAPALFRLIRAHGIEGGLAVGAQLARIELEWPSLPALPCPLPCRASRPRRVTLKWRAARRDLEAHWRELLPALAERDPDAIAPFLRLSQIFLSLSFALAHAFGATNSSFTPAAPEQTITSVTAARSSVSTASDPTATTEIDANAAAIGTAPNATAPNATAPNATAPNVATAVTMANAVFGATGGDNACLGAPVAASAACRWQLQDAEWMVNWAERMIENLACWGREALHSEAPGALLELWCDACEPGARAVLRGLEACGGRCGAGFNWSGWFEGKLALHNLSVLRRLERMGGARFARMLWRSGRHRAVDAWFCEQDAPARSVIESWMALVEAGCGPALWKWNALCQKLDPAAARVGAGELLEAARAATPFFARLGYGLSEWEPTRETARAVWPHLPALVRAAAPLLAPCTDQGVALRLGLLFDLASTCHDLKLDPDIWPEIICGALEVGAPQISERGGIYDLKLALQIVLHLSRNASGNDTGGDHANRDNAICADVSGRNASGDNARHNDASRQETGRDEANRNDLSRAVSRDDASYNDARSDDARGDDTRGDDTRGDDTRAGDARRHDKSRADTRRDDTRREEARREEACHDNANRRAASRDGASRNNARRDAARRDNTNGDDTIAGAAKATARACLGFLIGDKRDLLGEAAHGARATRGRPQLALAARCGLQIAPERALQALEYLAILAQQGDAALDALELQAPPLAPSWDAVLEAAPALESAARNYARWNVDGAAPPPGALKIVEWPRKWAREIAALQSKLDGATAPNRAANRPFAASQCAGQFCGQSLAAANEMPASGVASPGVASPGVASPDIVRLQVRLDNLRARLADRPRWRAQQAAEIAQLLANATPRAAFAALEGVLQTAFRARLQELCGVLPAEFALTDDWINAILLGREAQGNRKWARQLLRAEAGAHPRWREDLPGNAEFLRQLSARGVDVDFYLSKFGRRRGEFDLWLETEPLGILQMGNRFGTCLSRGGCNAFSSVTNAIELNKRVVYARDRKGTLVGRQLWAVSAEFGLLGFDVYSHLSGQRDDDLAAAFEAHAREFGRSCGLELADAGQVPLLVAPQWYDDGVRPWSADAIAPNETTRSAMAPNSTARSAMAPKAIAPNANAPNYSWPSL